MNYSKVNEWIKEFLKTPSIQQMLEDNDLESVYKNVGYAYRPLLTKFFLENDIKVLDYTDKIFECMFMEIPLSTFTVPDNIKQIQMEAFYRCDLLVDVLLVAGLEAIGVQAFGQCENLKNIHIPRTVQEIDEEAFDGCKSLKYVTILNDNIKIFDRAFDGCPNICIRCNKGSTAQEYCEINEIPFLII